MLDLKQFNHSFGLHQKAQMEKNNELMNFIIELRKKNTDFQRQIHSLNQTSHSHEVIEKKEKLWDRIMSALKKKK